jgi:hypothetical protein
LVQYFTHPTYAIMGSDPKWLIQIQKSRHK